MATAICWRSPAKQITRTSRWSRRICYPRSPSSSRSAGSRTIRSSSTASSSREGTYRLPLIVDRGTASTLGILPAFFLRQFELQLFAVAATTARSGDRHEAVGGALQLRFALWIVPLTLQYQLARRLTDDDALVHLVTLGP